MTQPIRIDDSVTVEGEFGRVCESLLKAGSPWNAVNYPTGDARIDEFRDLTIDKAEFGGHVYLDKAPGMTLLAPARSVTPPLCARNSAMPWKSSIEMPPLFVCSASCARRGTCSSN